MTFLFQVRLAHFLLVSLFSMFSLAHAAFDEEGSDASYISGSTRPASSEHPGRGSPSSSTRSTTPMSFDLRPLAPWKLSQVIVESWGLTELSDIGRLTETALQMQHAFGSDDLVSDIMTLGARYIHEVLHPSLSVQNVIDLLATLATLEEYYPRVDLRTSKIAYEIMIDQHRTHTTRLCTWEEQSHYLWNVAHTFHKTGGDPNLTREILDRSSSWILGWHTHQHRNVIIDLIAEAVLTKPQSYSDILDEALSRTSRAEAFEIIPFLQGIVFALPFIDPPATFSTLAFSTPHQSSAGDRTPTGVDSPYLPQRI